MIIKIIKTLSYIFVFTSISFTIVYLLNKNSLDLARIEPKSITPENYESIKDSIILGSIVEIKGTPDLLKQVAQESKDSELEVKNYFVGLKEYKDIFVVKIKANKLKVEYQTFKGKVININETVFGTRLKNSLNNPIELSDQEEADMNFDNDLKNLITQNSKGSFTDSSMLIEDEETLSARAIYINIALWTAVLALLSITIFRKRIFNLS